MIEISQGSIDNPFFNRETLSEAPLLHPTAVVRRSRIGAWTYLGAYCLLLDGDFHVGQCLMPRTARKKLLSQHFFELTYLCADRRLGDV